MTKTADSLPKGTQEEANSESSDKEVINKGSSQPEYVTVAEYQKLANQIESLRRGLQSGKDKGVKRVEERVNAIDADLKTVLQSAASRGQNISDFLAEVEEQEERETRQLMREFLASQRQGASKGESRGGGEQAVDVTEIIAELELDTSDTRVQAYRAKRFESEAEAYKEATRLLKSMTKQPTDADRASHVAGEKGAQDKQAALAEEYKERSKSLRGPALINLQREMRRKGLNI